MKRRAYLYFVVTFVIGVILGGVGLYTYAWNSGHWRRRWNEQAAIHSLQKQLDLSPQQVRDVRSIMDETTKQFHALQDQQRPEFDALRTQTDARIRQILNPHQATEFDALLERRHKGKGGKK